MDVLLFTMNSLFSLIFAIFSLSFSCAEHHEYGVMFDAGSTGTRIHVFNFSRNAGKDLALDSEFYREVKPGLSSYASNPKQGAESIRGLLNEAKGMIPAERWARSPIALKATAGLRLLPSKQQKGLLAAIRTIFEEYPFKFNPSEVEIIDGTHEGIYAWITVNFLLGNMGKPAESVGTLDLGGASTQIAFIPQENSTIKNAPNGYMQNVKLKSGSSPLYVHSYLGLGLMAARLQMLGHELGDRDASKPLRSPCLPVGYNKNWNYQGVILKVKSNHKTMNFQACVNVIKEVVKKYNIDAPNEIKSKKMYAFSYFYDRAKESGLIGSKGGQLSWKDYFERARTVCETDELKDDHPFMCMDLTYIAVLFRNGYKFDANNKFNVVKRLNGAEAGWTIGATFTIM